VSCEQPHTCSIAARQQPIPIDLDLVQPCAMDGQRAWRRQARLDKAWRASTLTQQHEADIAAPRPMRQNEGPARPRVHDRNALIVMLR
jgi:hypothetical protein